jgi:AbrB family looped-hinge helix DNA binding protein
MPGERERLARVELEDIPEWSPELPLLLAYDTLIQYCHCMDNVTLNPETRTRVNENGRVVIPASMRKALGINAGDEIVLRIEDDELRITTLKRRLERAQRRIRRYVKPGRSLVDELIAERGEAAKRE